MKYLNQRNYIIQWVNQTLNGREIFISEQVKKKNILLLLFKKKKMAIYHPVSEPKSVRMFHKEVILPSV